MIILIKQAANNIQITRKSFRGDTQREQRKTIFSIVNQLTAKMLRFFHSKNFEEAIENAKNRRDKQSKWNNFVSFFSFGNQLSANGFSMILMMQLDGRALNFSSNNKKKPSQKTEILTPLDMWLRYAELDNCQMVYLSPKTTDTFQFGLFLFFLLHFFSVAVLCKVNKSFSGNRHFRWIEAEKSDSRLLSNKVQSKLAPFFRVCHCDIHCIQLFVFILAHWQRREKSGSGRMKRN